MNRPYLLFVCDGDGFNVVRMVQGALQASRDAKVSLLWRGFDRVDLAEMRRLPLGAVVWGKLANIQHFITAVDGAFPIVSAIGSTLEHSIPTVAPDPFGIARQVAAHLVDEGLRSFVYVGGRQNPAARYRAEAFGKELRERLGDVRLQFFNGDLGDNLWGAATERGKAFLRLLKKESGPIGVFAFNDQVAASCMECAQAAGIRVPQDMSIVGVDDHPIYTQMYQSLSSVRVDFQEIGRRAAALILQLRRSRRPPDLPLHHFVGGELIVRQSSQPRLMGDEQISKALHYLHENYARAIALQDLARLVGMSRANFAARFQRATGRAPIRYLNRLRLTQAKLLLAESSLTVSEISHRVGIADQGYFTRSFKKLHRATPTQFRRQHGRRARGAR